MTLLQVHASARLTAHQTPNGTALWARRIMDLVLAGTGLLVLSPIMALVALAIWIESGRPIFFSQVRLGKGGRHFRIYKFRKFHKDNGTAGRRVTVKNDCRMTRPGKVLERTKLDELPQLWNILKGDMSVVGPRPESLELSDCFTGVYERVLDHKPGIFGPNQVLFRDEGCLYPDGSDPEQFYRDVLFPLKASIDLACFHYRTVLSDIRWIIRGVLAVFGLGSVPRELFHAVGRLDERDLTKLRLLAQSRLRSF
jgi:lipopolysaccharide/colanic/teichoic acid biosynthesis glycosyltransferase